MDGGAGGPGGAGFEGFGGFSDIFDAFFGGGAGAGSARRGRPQPGADLRYDLRITFEEAVQGTEKEIEFTVLQRVRDVRRQRRQAGHEPITCPQCNGRGEVRSVRQTMLGQMVNVSACPRCHGEGKIVETPCDTCHGDGRTERKRTLRVTIPPGIDEGHQIRLSNEGEVGPRGGSPGSLYVAVHVQPHPTLTREGTELYYDAEITIAQAALGTRITVPTVEGDEEVEVKAGTQPDTEIKLRGKGVPHLRRSGQRGDLHVMVDVVVPTKLTKRLASCSRPTPRRRATRSAMAAAGCSRSSGWGERGRRRAVGRGRPRRLAGAVGRGRHRGGRGGQRDPWPGGARWDVAWSRRSSSSTKGWAPGSTRRAR